MLLHHHRSCIHAAQEIVNFMCSLTQSNFEEFWMPCEQPLFSLRSYTDCLLSDASSHLTVTATLILRCALQANDSAVVAECMSDVQRLQTALEEAKAHHGWDLGDDCISLCKNYTTRVSATIRAKTAIRMPDKDSPPPVQVSLNDYVGFSMEYETAFSSDALDVEQWAHFDNGMRFYDGDIDGLSDEDFLPSFLNDYS